MSMPAQSDARPRSSPERLDDAEPDRRERALLETLLGRAVAAAPADVLLKRFGGLGALLAADKPELRRAGLQDDHVLYLKAVRDLAVLLARTEAEGRPVISSWSTLQAYVRTALAHCPREQFRVLYLDHRNALMRDEWLAEGTVDHAPVYPREVVRRALELSASALILVHNHPSGDPTPSQADIEMTRRVIEAARALGLQVHDHLVVARQGTSSFRALGLM